MKKPKPIHAVLESILKGLELDVPLRSYSIWGAWKQIVGESVALQTQPRLIRNRILFVDVSHPTWMQELQFLKSTLLEKINAYIGEPYIHDIRFKLGKISPPLPTPSEGSTHEEEELGLETLKRIESLLQKIDDKDIRKNLQEFLIKGAKLEQYRKRMK